MKVTFTDVGRDKRTWTAEIDELTDAALVRSIRKSALLSSGIDVEFETPTSGLVIVGGLRVVGRFQAVNENEQALAV